MELAADAGLRASKNSYFNANIKLIFDNNIVRNSYQKIDSPNTILFNYQLIDTDDSTSEKFAYF